MFLVLSHILYKHVYMRVCVYIYMYIHDMYIYICTYV